MEMFLGQANTKHTVPNGIAKKMRNSKESAFPNEQTTRNRYPNTKDTGSKRHFKHDEKFKREGFSKRSNHAKKQKLHTNG